MPHVIMSMHSSIPNEDKILVAEILAFVAVMWNRLVDEDLYPEQNIVPVSDAIDGCLLQSHISIVLMLTHYFICLDDDVHIHGRSTWQNSASLLRQ